MRSILTHFFFILLFQFFTPSATYGQTDSTTLTYQEYLLNITKYHPLAKQADLKIEMAKLDWLAAKGNLDPVLTSNWDQKEFDDKRYFRLFEGKLQVPTKLGIDFVAGYENTQGSFLNPENSTDRFGLWNVGIEVNLLQGLLVNERRTALEQATLAQDIAESQQQIMLNELLYDASMAYLYWQKYYYIQDVLQENMDIATLYFESTKQSYAGGEKTAMDTLEALIIFQDALTLTNYNQASLIKAKQNLENYLWFKVLPLELQDNTLPENYQNTIFEITEIGSAQNITLNHPMIQEKLFKQSSYELDLKLKKEKLKPKLKAKFNPLLATSDKGINPQYSANDYKFGFDFSFPLFLRSERAGVQRGQIKLEDIALDIQNKQNEILNKIENIIQQQVILQEQVVLQEQNVAGYKQLLDGENEKFRFGESSVFLLNKRQEKYINGKIKLIDLNIKLQNTLLDYLYYTNSLTN